MSQSKVNENVRFNKIERVSEKIRVSERLNQIATTNGLPHRWLELSLRHAEEIARLQAVATVATRALERLSIFRHLDRERILTLDRALTEVHNRITDQDILDMIQKARETT